MAQPKQIPGLDLVRLGAALFVVFYHFGGWGFWFLRYKTQTHISLIRFAWFGWVGVQIFFVLSGFVIAYSASSASPSRFLKSRFLRLYPTLWVCSVITLAVRCLAGTMPRGELFSSWLHSLPLSPYTDPAKLIDPSYWTLPVEIGFYALIFLLLVTRKFRFIGLAVCCMGLASAAFDLYRAGVDSHSLAPVHLVDRVIGRATGLLPTIGMLLLYGVFFALGTELWLLFFAGKTVLRLVLIGVFVCAGVVQIGMTSYVFIPELPLSSQSPTLPLWPIAAWLLALAAIALSVACNKQIEELLGPRGIRLARTLGLATYPLYLLHQELGYEMTRRLSLGPLSGLAFECVFILLRCILHLRRAPPGSASAAPFPPLAEHTSESAARSALSRVTIDRISSKLLRGPHVHPTRRTLH